MNFQELEALRRFLTETSQSHVSSLIDYHDPDSNGFYRLYADPNKKLGHFSTSSTATCVLSLVVTGRWSAGPWKDRGKDLANKMLFSSWESAGLTANNPYTVAFLFEAFLTLMETLGEKVDSKFTAESKTADRVAEAERILCEAIGDDGFARLEDYPASAYVTQLVVRVLEKRKSLSDDKASSVLERAWREIERQLALLVAKSKTADLFQLAYSIILVASLGDLGKATPDQSLILQAALNQLFDHQLDDGSWPRSRPLFHHSNLGSAYCYEYEMLAQLLSQATLRDKLLQFLPRLDRAARALQETAFKLAGDGLGWSSGHHSQIEGPESWSTASVYHFVHVLDRLVAEAVRRAVFDYFSTPYSAPQKPKNNKQEFAPDFVDCTAELPDGPVSLKGALLEHFVEPIAREAKRVEDGGSFSRGTPMSAIFFGPPGTSKTELAKQIAEYLRWPLLTIDPSHFVRYGMDKVQAQADQIFSMLAATERIVVLLDEFDEMVRDRHQSSEVLSRFLTTAMLPKLARINETRRIVFVVATNYIDQFDLAIRRPGRFDILVQVMPPTLEAKLARWTKVKALLESPNIHVERNDLKIKLEALTFLEFGTLAARLETATDPQTALGLVDEASRNCTLSSRFDPQSQEDRSWRTVCEEQREKMRLPPPPKVGAASP